MPDQKPTHRLLRCDCGIAGLQAIVPAEQDQSIEKNPGTDVGLYCSSCGSYYQISARLYTGMRFSHTKEEEAS